MSAYVRQAKMELEWNTIFANFLSNVLYILRNMAIYAVIVYYPIRC
jgi:hypothetical protein